MVSIRLHQTSAPVEWSPEEQLPRRSLEHSLSPASRYTRTRRSFCEKARRMTGRRTKLTPEAVDGFLQATRSGRPGNSQAQPPDSRGRPRSGSSKRDGKPQHWTAAAWLLERRLPDACARPIQTEITGRDGGPIPVDVSASDLLDQLRRIADAEERVETHRRRLRVVVPKAVGNGHDPSYRVDDRDEGA